MVIPHVTPGTPVSSSAQNLLIDKVNELDAALAPDTQQAIGGSSFDLTITTFGTAASAGSYSEVAVVFDAPASGRVELKLAARLINTGAGGTIVAPETRTGSTIGSGTVVDAVDDQRGVSHYGTSFSRNGCTHLLTGLTPGATYNTRLLHRVTSGTGSVALRTLIAAPAT